MPKQSIQQAAQERKRKRRPAAAPVADAHPLVGLQRQVGNAQVSRMLAGIQRAGEEDELAQAKRDPGLQRAGEEDELAQAKRDPSLQRQRDAEDDEMDLKRDPSLQRESAATDDRPEVGPEGGPISGELNSRIQNMRGGGSRLDDGLRTRMEGRLGSSFADVRVHTGGEAASLSRRLGATAFTTGRDIFFGGNASPSDERLLAHELTHVVQQGGAAGGGPLTVGAADDSHEQQAEQVASDVTGASA